MSLIKNLKGDPVMVNTGSGPIQACQKISMHRVETDADAALLAEEMIKGRDIVLVCGQYVALREFEPTKIQAGGFSLPPER